MAYPKKAQAEKVRLVTLSFAPGVIAKLDALAAEDAVDESRAPNRSAFVARLVVAEHARRDRRDRTRKAAAPTRASRR
jgi:hypothetical protein